MLLGKIRPLLPGGKEGSGPPPLELVRAGNATVVRLRSEPAAEALALGASLARDDEYDLLVVALPAGTGEPHWAAVADVVGGGQRGIRLVPAGGFQAVAPAAARWLAGRLGRAVLAPDGALQAGPNGGLFAGSGAAGGWFKFRPGQDPVWAGRRFPVPSWESPAVADRRQTAAAGTVEPLPAGVWLRPEGDERWVDAGRARLRRWLCCRPDALAVVLGGHGLPELPLELVVTWWKSLPEKDRGKVRFVHYGPVEAADGHGAGPVVADRLGRAVTFYNGLPIDRSGQLDVLSVRADGSHGGRMFAQELVYRPDGPPELRSHRRPLAGLEEFAPGQYRYRPDVVLEVVAAGLWIRPAAIGDTGAATVRALPPDPAVQAVYHEGADFRALAEEVLDRLDEAVRPTSRVLRAPGTASPEEASEPSLPMLRRLFGGQGEPEAAERTEVLPSPGSGLERTEVLRRPVTVQPSPGPEADPGEPEAGLGADLAWLDRAHGEALAADAGAVRAIFGPNAGDDVLAQVAAARMYLTGATPDLDARLRSAAAGPHVSLARCVRAGLARLPVHRGATVGAVASSPELWDFLGDPPVLTERGFLDLLNGPGETAAGDTDLLLWSMSGRLTAAVEPEPGGHRVVFLPGTSFRVLGSRPPGGGERGRILLRELGPAEVSRAGGAGPALDALTTTSLERALRHWSDRPGPAGKPSTSDVRTHRVPGIG